MARWLEDRGVPGEDVFLDHAGFRTLDTMQRAARVFGVRSAVICTQAFHLPRAVWLARKAGIDAVGLEAACAGSGALLSHGREVLAIAAAVFDTATGRGPRYLGPAIAIDGDDQPVALGAVAGTRTGFDGSAALPVGIACVDFRDYFDPVLGLNMLNAQEGDAQIKETVAVATGQTAHYWDIVYPMDPMWVGK